MSDYCKFYKISHVTVIYIVIIPQCYLLELG